MRHSLSLQDIKSLCGTTSYKRGEAYYKSHRVLQLNYDPDEQCYHAVVSGSKRYNVKIELDQYGYMEAECDCPAFHSYYDYCKHIAAVLLHIHALNQSDKVIPLPSQHKAKDKDALEPVISSRDMQLTRTIISLFDNPSDTEENVNQAAPVHNHVLDVEFTCKAITYSSRKNLFGIEMRIGSSKRLYIVQKIKDFLSKIEQHTPHSFSKHFTFDPSVHTFKETDWALIQQLIEIHRNETVYREALSSYSIGYVLSNDRVLFIPPLAWERLLPKLTEAAVKFEHEGRTYDHIEIKEGHIPLTFQLNKASAAGYQLDIQGLDQVTMMDNYGYVLAKGTLYKLTGTQINRLAKMKEMFQYAPQQQVVIAPSQIETFIERVIPELKKISSVSIAQQISDQIVNPPLHARLYLNWDDDRMLARLEYEYDDMVIDPFHSGADRQDQSGRILLRDVEQENRIMRLFEQSSFKYNGSELYMDEEEGMYHFLYHILPPLEKVAEVYITPSLKSMMHRSLHPPKVKVDVDSKTQWLDIDFDLEGIDEQEIRHILQSVVEKKKYYRLPDGAFLSLEEDGFEEISRFIEEMGIRKSEIKGKHMELSVVRGFHLLDSNERTPAIKLGKSLRHLLENIRNPDNLDFEVPETLSPVLRDYQKYGFQWMKTLAYYHFGGILADDMGLGKTLQSIAFILSERQEITATGLPVLIVSPASLVYNWKNEVKKFAPELKAVVATGDKQERSEILDELSNVDVVITSYPLLRRDMELYMKHRFHTLILDEAQAVKNHATQTAQAIRGIQAKHRFALTGTPIENSLEELWSIFDAVFPELFSSKKAFTELPRETVAKRVRPFILRRMKSDVLKELPEKIETLQTSELSPEQKKLYMAYLAKLQKETIEQLEVDGFQKNRMRILAGLTRLRQLCCHPSLFIENYTGASGKLEQLMEIVEQYQNAGKRMLIFSQFTEMLGIIRQELTQRGLSYFYLDGKTPASERVELCRRFNEGEHDVFLISLKAGGTGLNLTGADTVILYDLWWNPAVEQQAADRAHRMGQKNVVQVIRLVTEGTIEEKMYELQQRKKDLIDEVIQPGEAALSTLTEKEIRELLMI
jgi:SNF2 family DNA or RNA helicase